MRSSGLGQARVDGFCDHMMDAMNTEAIPALLFAMRRLHPDSQLPRHGGAGTTKKWLEELGMERPIQKRQPVVIESPSITLTGVTVEIFLPLNSPPLHPAPRPKPSQPAP